jgi:hypothetical protein
VRGEQQAFDVLRAHARHVEIGLKGVERQQAVVQPVGEPLGGARVLLPLAGADADRAQFGPGILAQIVFFTGVLGFWILGFCFWAGGIFGIEGGVGGWGGVGALPGPPGMPFVPPPGNL